MISWRRGHFPGIRADFLEKDDHSIRLVRAAAGQCQPEADRRLLKVHRVTVVEHGRSGDVHPDNRDGKEAIPPVQHVHEHGIATLGGDTPRARRDGAGVCVVDRGAVSLQPLSHFA